MTQSGRRFAPKSDDLEQQSRTAARGLDQATDMGQNGPDEQARPFIRGRKRAALMVAPLLLMAFGGTAFALNGTDDRIVQAEPVPAAIAPSVAPTRDHQPNRDSGSRPSLIASSAHASTTAAKPSTTAAKPSTIAAPSTTAAKPSTTAAKTTAATTAAAATTASPSAKPVTAALAEVSGTRYTTTGVNVRAKATTGAEVVVSLAKGAAVSSTGVQLNEFSQIRYNGKAAYVSSDYLTKTKPAAPTPTQKTTSSSSTSSSSGSSNSGGGISGAACSKSSGIESGLTSNGVKAYRAICANFPAVSSFGGYRPSADMHGSGRAIDAMVSGAAGWEIANWVRANASSLGVTEVIYSQKIWTTQRSGDGWRSMSDRGSTTANHYDHVHVTVR